MRESGYTIFCGASFILRAPRYRELNMNRIQYGNWIPGGVVRTWSQKRSVWHFGIAGSLGVHGPVVLHASKDRGEFAATPASEFAEGQTLSYTWLPKNFEEQQLVLNRAESQIGKPFRLLNSNCEDYVNWIVTGTARSPQREKVVAALLLSAVVIGIGAALSA